MASLSGRAALITGGSRGIGRAVACAFAQEGASVAINHHDDKEQAQAVVEDLQRIASTAGHNQSKFFALPGDISDCNISELIIHDTKKNFGSIDILVNNAGIQNPTPIDSFDYDVFMRIMSINLMGAVCMSRSAISIFKSQGAGGVIVNTSSVHEIIPKPGFLAYSLSKGAMGNLTRTLALECVGDGIRVNAVAPGAVATDMNASWANDPDRRRMVEGHIPMGYAAAAEDIAPAFVFLAGDGSRYMTGQTLYLCGGLTLFGEFSTPWAS